MRANLRRGAIYAAHHGGVANRKGEAGFGARGRRVCQWGERSLRGCAGGGRSVCGGGGAGTGPGTLLTAGGGGGGKGPGNLLTSGPPARPLIGSIFEDPDAVLRSRHLSDIGPAPPSRIRRRIDQRIRRDHRDCRDSGADVTDVSAVTAMTAVNLTPRVITRFSSRFVIDRGVISESLS